MISVGMPVVKTKYFEQAFVSILHQNFDDYEIIVVNNNADGDVKSIIDKYNSPRVRYYKNELMLPIIENWNKVLSYASGEYFVLFSDDDIYAPTFLSEMYNLMQRYPEINIAHCRVKIIDEENRTLEYTPICPEYENIIDFMWHRLKRFRLQYAPDFMVKTQMLKACGGFVDFPLAWGSDDATWFTIAKQSGVIFLNKALCNWRFSNISLSKVGNPKLKIMAVEKYICWIENFLTGIDSSSEESQFQINHIRHLLPEFKRYGIIYLFSVTSGTGFFSLFRIILAWWQLRREYQIDLLTLGGSLAIKIRDLYFSNRV
jgi:glycosyltransferase involved in cell wall biosynthesis